MEGEEDDVKGKSEYQHHARNNNMYLSEYLDYFSEYIIYLTIKSLSKFPDIWNMLDLANKDSHILNKNELQNIKNSRIYSIVKNKNDDEILTILLYIDDMWQNKNSLSSIIPIEKVIPF